jgi:hypothetical protein
MLRNRNGTVVDPVPFLVVVALGFLVAFSFGPIYAGAVGLSVRTGLAVSAGVFSLVVIGAYVRLVRQAIPEARAEIPPERRLTRLLYAALGLALLFGGLTLPLL